MVGARAAGVSPGCYGPGGPVPVQDERHTWVVAVGAGGPNIIAGNGGDSPQVVLVRPHVRAGYNAPLNTVPTFDQRVVHVVGTGIVLAYDPGIISGYGCDPV